MNLVYRQLTNYIFLKPYFLNLTLVEIVNIQTQPYILLPIVRTINAAS